MNRTINKTALFFALVSLALAAATLLYASKAEARGRAMRYRDEQAMNELVAQLSQMDSALNKLKSAPEGRSLQTAAAKLWQCAETAKSCMSSLSLPDGALDKTQKYVGQTGDFAYYLLFSAAGGQQVSLEHRQALQSLCRASQSLTEELNAVNGQLDRGRMVFSDAREDQLPLSDGLSGVEQEFPEYASLIYDGPFSEHLTYAQPRLLSGLPDVDLQQAIRGAAAFCELPVTSLSLLYEGAGRIPCWCLTDGKGITAEVSKQGGIVFGYRNSRFVAEAQVAPEDAIRRAADFLARRGFKNMKESYWSRYDNTITVNFAYTENDITVYGDLIKVSVALDDGEVVGMEARGYLMSHRDRTLPRPVLTESEGSAQLEDVLTVRSGKLALIPTSGQDEVLCREYICENGDGAHVICYLNAITGQQENMFLLIEDENGTLVL